MEWNWEWEKAAILIYGYNIFFKKKLEGWPQTYYLVEGNLELF